jgi:hypothetical protein
MFAEEEEHVTVKKVPFGDTFGSKADYSTGTFYAGRRQFLVMEEDGSSPVKQEDEKKVLESKKSEGNVLQPPHEFMTRKQSLRFVQNLKSDKLSTLQNMSYFNQDAAKVEVERERKRKQMLMRKKEQNKPIVLQKFSSIDPAVWEEEVQAGCKMWVNHLSGEVSDYPPWKSIDEIEEEKAKLADEEEVEGTGAPVYDNSELEEFLRELDRQPASPTKKK